MVMDAAIRSINLTFRAAGNILETMRFDLHTHTTLSQCSQLSLDQLLDAAGAQGLDGVCITDHDTMAVRHQIREGQQANGLCVLFGMEYATSAGDFLIFGPYEDIAANLSAPELLGHVARSGGVAVAAHPFRPGRPVVKELMEQGLCQVVEGVNGRNRDEDNLRALAWQELYGSHLTGGSDAHSRAEVGRVSTLFQTEIRNRADLIKALRSGNFFPATLLQPYALCS